LRYVTYVTLDAFAHAMATFRWFFPLTSADRAGAEGSEGVGDH
jgi:hypothetical protein